MIINQSFLTPFVSAPWILVAGGALGGPGGISQTLSQKGHLMVQVPWTGSDDGHFNSHTLYCQGQYLGVFVWWHGLLGIDCSKIGSQSITVSQR